MADNYILLQNQAYDYIADMIEHNKLEFDKIYSEHKIASEIGISRTPVRDAIHRLSQDGFIDIIPSKGFCLHRLSPADIRETYQVRSAIESYCAGMTAADMKSCDPETAARAAAAAAAMEKLLDAQKELVNKGGSREDLTSLDNDFHKIIHTYPQNAAFESLFSRYLYRIRCITMDSFAAPKRIEDTLKEHEAILNAIKAGDSDGVRLLVLRHIQVPTDLVLTHPAADEPGQEASGQT